MKISKNTSKTCNSYSITLRLNKQEKIMLDTLITKYKIKRKSSFIKQILFNEIKPYLSAKEKELISAYIIELNYIGRNLNQFLKYRASDEVLKLLEDIKAVIQDGKKIL